ncbi:MAG TPA: insulinase family protein, partial [Clostridia bacterium]|nr:insulinase family protein [Clostridia bacterium]
VGEVLMTINLIRTALSRGVNLSVLSDPKFKHNRISINLIVPLDAQTVSRYAILPFLMRKGSQSCKDFTQLNRRLDAMYGAALAADVSKSGSNQIITLGVKTLDDRFTLGGEALVQQAATLLRELLMEPLIEDGAFDRKEFFLERQNLVDTIESLINDKRSYALAQCRMLMGRSDAAALQKYGTVEQAEALTPKEAAQAYQQLLDTAAVEIMFIGSGDPSAASEVMKKAFAGLARDPHPFSDAKICSAGEETLKRVEYLDVAQSKMVLGFRCDQRGDVAEQAAMRLMTALYGGTPSSKLFLNVREKLSLCYYCAARYERASAIMTVDCGVEKENIENAKKEILVQLDEIRNGNFDDETLENTRLQLKNSLRAVSDYPGTLEEWYLSRILAGEIVSPEQEMHAIDVVTREQVIEAAKQVRLDAIYLLTSKEDSVDA